MVEFPLRRLARDGGEVALGVRIVPAVPRNPSPCITAQEGDEKREAGCAPHGGKGLGAGVSVETD